MDMSCEEESRSHLGKRSRTPPLDMSHRDEDEFVLVAPSAEALAQISPTHGCQVAWMHGLFGSDMRVPRRLLLTFLRDWAATALARNSYAMLQDTMRLASSCSFRCGDVMKNLDNRLLLNQPTQQLVARVNSSMALTYARRHAVAPDGNLEMVTNSKWDEKLASGQTMREWWGLHHKEVLSILIHSDDHIHMYHGIGRLMSQLISHVSNSTAKRRVPDNKKPLAPFRTTARVRLALQAAPPGSASDAPPAFTFVPVYHEGTLSNPRPCHSPTKTPGIAPASAMRAPDALLRHGLTAESARMCICWHCGRQSEITLTLVFSNGAFWIIHEVVPLAGEPAEDLDPAKHVERSQVFAHGAALRRAASETPCSETGSEANSLGGNSSEGTSDTTSPTLDAGGTVSNWAVKPDRAEPDQFEAIELTTFAELDQYFGM